MQQWEYYAFTTRASVKQVDLQALMNGELRRLGMDGWELVNTMPVASSSLTSGPGGTTEILWVFKRPYVPSSQESMSDG